VDYDATQVMPAQFPALRRAPSRPDERCSFAQIGDVLGGRYEILQLLGEAEWRGL